MEGLASSDVWFLVSSSPVHSEEILLHPNVTQISSTILCYTDLTRLIPSTVLEENLQIVLCESQAHEQYWKSRTVDLQSGFVLQELYCKKVRRQLVQKEKRNGKGRSQQLNRDGMPHLLTSNDFYDRVIDHEETAIREEEEKKAHRDAQESHSKAMALWRKKDDQRKACNKKKMEQWEKDVHLWEAECDLAKVEQ
ncbi:hypothetical protein EV421DRAFT_1715421 [Armillaria borealis]|uniref:Uncharacterized protein n=1 Tax=Armillaria borealis TaxID=47425 RepID=A0AA39J6M2_9AGAR|nr:hypothetical protein EV421DRAFT_1715421 [Armillaria borealis]